MEYFKDFKLNIKDNYLKKANEHKVYISIKSDYKWGSGWTLNAKKKFEDIVYNALEDASDNFYIIPSPEDYTCPYLKSKEKHNNLNLYLHPMEFTGYANQKDLDLIIKTLKEKCKDVIYDIKLTQNEEIYNIPDQVYSNIIYDNAKEIADKAAEIKEKNGTLWDIGFDFASECRIKRLNDKACFSSNDVDIKAVENIVTVADKLGYIDNKIKEIRKQKNEDIDESFEHDDIDYDK